MSNTILSLYELNALVRDVISDAFDRSYWVTAELSEMRESRGHCYMELIEREGDSAVPIARASAKCWSRTWMLVKEHFERTTGNRMAVGMKLLLEVTANFHEAYGFSWIVVDIDPTYTMGDVARKRREILAQLTKEGVIDLQRSLELPILTQRIAVVSAATAAGYGDFVDQLHRNTYGFAFETTLFQATMQGEQTERSVIAALDEIAAQRDNFDCVVIVRGGGATSDLGGFDTLLLAENVANFPLPIIVGIGHERDESVLDVIAHTSVKTPTAAAAFLVDRLLSQWHHIESLQAEIAEQLQQRMSQETQRLNYLTSKIPTLFSLVKTKHEHRLNELWQSLESGVQLRLHSAVSQLELLNQRLQNQPIQILSRKQHHLELLSHRLEAVNPQRILEKGYSLTTRNGHVVSHASALNDGDEIVTRFVDGEIKSTIKK